jgi:hypothetical protein
VAQAGETEPGLRPTVLALSHLSAGAGEEPSIRILCSSQRQHNFALDSPLEQAGFELVWGFSCQVVVLGFAESSLFGAGKPFFIPSPAIRFAERAEGVKGPKR